MGQCIAFDVAAVQAVAVTFGLNGKMENRIMNLFRDGCRNDDVGFVLVAETFNVLIENFGCTDNR